MKLRSLLICVVLMLPLTVAQAQTQKAVLVTGASSGIGLKITEYLAEAGHFVYAGARKQADLDRLDKMENVQSIKLDVTVPAEIAAAVETIDAAGRGLYAVVNNAGVAIFGPLVDVAEADFNFQMNVNVYGPYRITRAFSPLVVAAKGRLVTIGSIAGTVSPPSLGPYSMTKHAMEAFTDALAGEMAPLGVQVSVVEPGNYKSKIGASAFARMFDEEHLASGELTPAQQKMKERGADDRARYKEPDEVAAAVMQALFDENPQRRYMVVPNQGEAEFTIRQKITELVQLNGNQPYTYDRKALIGMLDEALAQEK